MDSEWPADAPLRNNTDLAVVHDCDVAARVAPSKPNAHYYRGTALKALGRLDEARQTFEKAIALAPRRAEFHRALAEAKRFAASDPQLAAMEALAQEALAQEALAQGGATLSTNGRTHLQFALARECSLY